MEWERRFLETLHASRPSYDEPPDWRAALAFYDADPDERLLLAMIDEEYRNPFSSRENLPFDDVMVNLPAGMAPDDLLSIEAAVMIAAERGLGVALFAFNRLMRSPRWHPLSARLFWLNTAAGDVQRKLMATTAGRFLGAMLGLACGDALGVTLEFQTRSEIRRKYPDGHREISGGGPFGFAAGEWSDDTAMALAVARGILESPGDPVEPVGRHFQDWYGSHPPDVGTTCRRSLETHRRLGSWEATTREVERQLGTRAAGNGALMRTLPAALVYGPDPGPAVRIARMTHPHHESDAAVAVYQLMVDALLQGPDKTAAFAAGLTAAGPLKERLQRVPAMKEAEVRSTGYVVDTLEAAIWCFLTTQTLEECLVRAANLGDDADTVAAVAGGLAGSAYGAAAIPRRWSLALKNRSELETVAERLYLTSNRR
ncbi:MAG TPA: ADP-ribosylglycohydrolase family protein [Symbiobacteriaceae bacterium]|nr:ADP-ribosylglycohydrolase family protein [Symbiobacteriaceae bacterium]